MKYRTLLLVLANLILMSGLAGCGATEDPAGAKSSGARVEPSSTAGGATSSATQPAPKTPREDWCGEHGLPESACTKCNPELIAAFKAKGDWCEGHGFPESFCPFCSTGHAGHSLPSDPGNGARAEVEPDLEDHGGGPPPDGTKIVFRTDATAQLAGIRTVEASSGDSGASLLVAARLVYDSSKVARVNARSAGVVKEVSVDIGARVRPGSRLALIESAGVGADLSRLRAARSRMKLAETYRARVQVLHDEGLVAEMEVLAAERDLDEAKADLDTAMTALGMVEGTNEEASQYALASPIAGVVASRAATIGRMVDTEEVLFEIVDTSTLWAEIEIPETAVSRVAAGQRVVLSVAGLEGRELSGELSSIAPEIDPGTRTARGRVRLANPDGVLRANMFARAALETGDAGISVRVPRDAVQRARGAQLVFVRLAERVYEARRVVTGIAVGEFVEVAGRLSPGERVVTDGSFLLKTETLKDDIGAGCCDVERPR